MDASPLPVQKAIEAKTTAATISGLGTRLGLHIDVIGKIAALNVLMLLGLIGPEDFLKELIAAGVSDKDAREIMTEINQKIFVPLREQMKSGAGNTSQQRPQTATPPAPRPVQVQAPVPSYAYAQPKQSSPQPIPPKPAQPIVQAPPPVQPRPIQQQIAPAPSVPQIQPARAVNIGRLLEDHEEPHIDLNKNSVPPNLPGTMTSPAMPKVRPSPRPAAALSGGGPAIPKIEFIKPAATVRPYSTDPYREPLDEK